MELAIGIRPVVGICRGGVSIRLDDLVREPMGMRPPLPKLSCLQRERA